MERFVDTHCHILSGVDDGAQTVEEMQQMLRMAYEDGIRYIIATPHHHPRRGIKPPGALRAQLKTAREEAAKISGELRVYLGTEVYFGQDIPDMLKAGEILTMNRTDLVLAEFSNSDPFDYICQGIQQLQMKGFEVILAHVERYACMYKSPDYVEHLTHMGVKIQINADSITGGSGWRAKRFTRKLLERRLVFCVGTDAHDASKRPPRMRAAAEYVEKKCGEEYARRIFFSNARVMLKKKKKENESGQSNA